MLTIGMDVGGTNLPVGIVERETRKLLVKDSFPRTPGIAPVEALGKMCALARALVARIGRTMDEVAYVGIGLPGVMDPRSGVLKYANNLGEAWQDFPVKAFLEERLGCPAHMDNDANAAAWAEYLMGACKDARDAVMLTLGTGLGGAIILDGRRLMGRHFVGGEVGHMILVADGERCACGNRGCAEQYTSATALIRWGREMMAQHSESMLHQKTHGDMRRLSAKDVVDCAKAGDTAALVVFERYVHYLALFCVSIVNSIDPEVIVLGGGVSLAGDFLLEAVRRETARYIIYKSMPYAQIELAVLGSDAGVLGAALLGEEG
nr:ROK family protein [Maliibacterium massiliense]